MPVGPVMNGPVRRLVADVDVDDIPTAPEPAVIGPVTFSTEAPVSEMPADVLEPFTLPVIVIVMAVADETTIPAPPLILPDITTVEAPAIDNPTPFVVPNIFPLIVKLFPLNNTPKLEAPADPPNKLPVIVRLPAD